jgi:3-methyladenine DNA glycosylase AlkD
VLPEPRRSPGDGQQRPPSAAPVPDASAAPSPVAAAALTTPVPSTAVPSTAAPSTAAHDPDSTDEVSALLAETRAALARRADATRADAMRRYMKSALPFLGVPKPARADALRPVLAGRVLARRPDWDRAVRELWDGATYREERYAALALAEHRAYRSYRDPAALPLCQHLIVTGAWWDLVDETATRLVAPIRRGWPAEVDPLLLAWARADDLWLRRAAVISQIGSKAGTDRALLAAVLEPNLADRRFFVAKAVGWALRDLAWHDPTWVQAYVAAHRTEMAPLSVRQALKNL